MEFDKLSIHFHEFQIITPWFRKIESYACLKYILSVKI